MIRRPRRTTAASLVAVVLLAACALVATCAIQMLAGQRPVISYTAVAQLLNRTPWTDPAVAVAGGVGAALGLILLLVAIVPGRATVVPLDDDDTGLDAGASRRGMRAALRAAADSVDGVQRTALTIRHHVVAATVRTDRTTAEGLGDRVRAALERRLDQIAPATRPELRVRVTSTRSPS